MVVGVSEERVGGVARHWPWALALLAAAAAATWLSWVGFMASDDSLYYAGTVPWLEGRVFAGTDHWSTRFPLTLTFAAVLALLGSGFLAFAATAMIFYVALVAVAGVFASRVAGARAGWVAALLVATMPVVVGHATTVSVDLTEAAALLLGILLLTDATKDRRGQARALAAGVAFGVAVLCRETSVLPLAGLAIPCALGRPVPRSLLIVAGGGCALVLGAEALFQWALTGDPLHRWTLAFNHDSRIDRAANHEGNFLLWPPVDPLLVLLVNDDFGLLFWAAGAAMLSGAAHFIPAASRGRMAVLGWMAGAAFVLVALLVTKLVLNPRYFTLPALAAAVLVAAWAAHRPTAVKAGAVALLIATNLLLAGLGNAHPRWRAEMAVQAAIAHRGEPVWGVPNDVARNEIPIAFDRITNLRGGEAPRGGLQVANADEAPSGTIVARYPSPPTRVGAIVRAVGLEPLVPDALSHRLLSPSPEAVLVRRD